MDPGRRCVLHLNIQLQFFVVAELKQEKIIVNKCEFIFQGDQLLVFVQKKIFIYLSQFIVIQVCLVGIVQDKMIQGIQCIEKKMWVHLILQSMQFRLRTLLIKQVGSFYILFFFLGEEKYFIKQCKDDHRYGADNNESNHIAPVKCFI